MVFQVSFKVAILFQLIAPDYKTGGDCYSTRAEVCRSRLGDCFKRIHANTGEKKTNEDERELPSTVTLLVTPEQGNILVSLRRMGRPIYHLYIVVNR